MATIPPHFTDRFIVQRYNKALHFVQHLPVTSSFQPTKSQKLELYALYKQVSVGDINTQRPGLFDVVGRAKWDAWKKLEGTSILEARHIYVEALLRAATEAYKKNLGREEAQQIIHAFAIMRPSGDDDDSDDLLEDTTTDDNTSNQEDSSVASEDVEEQAYLRDVQQSTIKVTSFTVPDSNTATAPYGTPDRPIHQHRQSPILTKQPPPRTNRPGSVASVQTMVTAPTTPRQLPLTRPPSAATSVRTTTSNSNRRRPAAQMTARDNLRGNLLEEEFIDENVNPWQQIPPTTNNNQMHDSGASSSEEESRHHHYRYGRRSKTPNSSQSQMRLPSPMYHSRRLTQLSSPPLNPQLHGMTPIQQAQQQQQFQSPVFGSSASSSITATPHTNNFNSSSNNNNSRSSSRMVYTPTSANESLNSRLFDHQRQALPSTSMTTVALGPATKRALESLQNEVIALNDRIDDLRRELMERNKQRSIQQDNSSEASSDDFNTDSWKWVIKAALKYAGVNLMTAFVLFLILYKSNSPVAYAILKQSNKIWQSFKLRVLISNVVV